MLNRLGLLALIGVVGVSACDDDEETGPTAEVYTATLNGASESPPVTTTATGTATFTVEGNNLDYVITITNWPAGRTVTAAHIHCAPPAGQTTCAPLKGWPAGSITTTGGSGTIALSDTELAGIRAGGTYYNVHSSVNAGGEIRGNLARQ